MDRGRRGPARGGRPRPGGRGDGGGRGRGPGRGQGWESEAQGRDANAQSVQGTQIVSTSSQGFELGKLARRPDGGGRTGRRIQVYANFFAMRCGLERAWHYNLEVKGSGEARLLRDLSSLLPFGECTYLDCGGFLGEGDVAPTGQQDLPMNLARSVVNECSIQHNWPNGWVFDGKRNIYATSEIFDRAKRTYTVDMSDGSRRERKFDVNMQLATTVSLLDLRRFLERGDIAIPRDAIQTIEVCLRYSASNSPQCHLAGRSIYFNDPGNNFALSGGTELWLGYHQGVKLCQQGLMLNVDTTCTAFLQQRAVLELFSEATKGPIERCQRMEQWMYQAMKKTVTNVMVSTTHRNDSKKHKCRGLTIEPASNLQFSLKDGSTTNVAQYWAQQYGRLRYPYLPCLDVSKGKRVNYLPPEVCEVVAGQRVQNLTEDQTRGTIKFSAKKAEERRFNITKILKKANIAGDSNVRNFGVEIREEMAQAPARVLPQPHLQYKRPDSMDTGDRGAWNLEGVKFFKPGELRSWAVVSFLPPRVVLTQGEQGLPDFMENLTFMMQEMGMTVENGRPPLIYKEQNSTSDTLQKAMNAAQSTYGQPADLLLVLLERKEPGPYQEVKRTAEGPIGVTTQCFVAKSAGIGCPPRGRMQYLANLAMKINQKLGGVNTQIAGTLSRAFPVLGRGANKPFIVFGADVTHPTGFDKNEPSVGAIVASMDPHLGQFAARVLTMAHREEKMSMKDAIRDLFKQFFQRNRVKPEAVFFYRDGVSEGQFQEVFEHEYNEIREACQMLEPDYTPPITLILVQKNHHTRLFPFNPREGDRNGNIVPGTCVDSAITSKYDFDFYLNSHAGIQGTNRPSHYYVLVDENGFGSDGIQLFSYWMCYLYCRCTRSVSYAPPAYYAHLAALHGRYLVGTSSDSSSEGSTAGTTSIFNTKLDQKMFFI